MAFRDHVKEEALAQRQLRKAGQPIPPAMRRYARLSGAIVFVGSGLGFVVILTVARDSGFVSVFGLLFTAVFALGGLAQLLTGRHLLTRR